MWIGSSAENNSDHPNTGLGYFRLRCWVNNDIVDLTTWPIIYCTFTIVYYTML